MSDHRSAFLVVQAGGSVGKEFPLNKDTITIGRALDNDVILDDEQVSRHHANIRRQDEQFVLTDLASANGTYVDRRRISEPHALRAGDMIQIGSLVLEFLGSAPDAATVIGVPGGGEQTVVTAPPAPAPRYAPPPPQPAYTAAPPPPAYAPPPAVAPTRPAKKKGGGGGGWCGCLIVIVIILISLAVLAVAGYFFAIMFAVLPDTFGILPMLGLQPGSLM